MPADGVESAAADSEHAGVDGGGGWWSGLGDEDGVGPEGAFLSYYRRQRLCESREAWEQSEVTSPDHVLRSDRV